MQKYKFYDFFEKCQKVEKWHFPKGKVKIFSFLQKVHLSREIMYLGSRDSYISVLEMI